MVTRDADSGKRIRQFIVVSTFHVIVLVVVHIDVTILDVPSWGPNINIPSCLTYSLVSVDVQSSNPVCVRAGSLPDTPLLMLLCRYNSPTAL